MDLLAQFQQQSAKTIESLKEELKSFRTGRATPSLVENIIVETYGGTSKLRLMELATIITEGPQILSIIPFDPSVLVDIEKAILKSSLGITPQTQAGKILLKLPPLSQEQREKLIKLIGQTVENKKQIIRNLRDYIRKNIKGKFERKEMSDDQKYQLEKEIDQETQKFLQEIQKIKESKEKEILEI
ncbi:MAG: ribosome-recycling factor [Microgenomates group bacterium]